MTLHECMNLLQDWQMSKCRHSDIVSLPAGDPFAMLEGLQDPQAVSNQDAPSAVFSLDALYGTSTANPPAPTPAPKATPQNEDPFGLGGLTAPTPSTSNSGFGVGDSSWPIGETHSLMKKRLFASSTKISAQKCRDFP